MELVIFLMLPIFNIRLFPPIISFKPINIFIWSKVFIEKLNCGKSVLSTKQKYCAHVWSHLLIKICINFTNAKTRSIHKSLTNNWNKKEIRKYFFIFHLYKKLLWNVTWIFMKKKKTCKYLKSYIEWQSFYFKCND